MNLGCLLVGHNWSVFRHDHTNVVSLQYLECKQCGKHETRKYRDRWLDNE